MLNRTRLMGLAAMSSLVLIHLFLNRDSYPRMDSTLTSFASIRHSFHHVNPSLPFWKDHNDQSHNGLHRSQGDEMQDSSSAPQSTPQQEQLDQKTFNDVGSPQNQRQQNDKGIDKNPEIETLPIWLRTNVVAVEEKNVQQQETPSCEPCKICEPPVPPPVQEEPAPCPRYHPPRRQQTFATNEFSFSGLGNKFLDAMFGIKFAKDHNLTYVFNEASFVINPRENDHQWLSRLIAGRYPPQNLLTTRFYRSPDLFKLPDISDEDTFHYDGYYIDQHVTCGGNNCFYPEGNVQHLNDVRDLQDLLGVTPENRVRRVAIHLRFGDITHYLEPRRYLQIVQALEAKFGSGNSPRKTNNSDDDHNTATTATDTTMTTSEPPLPSLMDNVHFVYHLGQSEDSHPVMKELRELFPNAVFKNEVGVQESMRYLASSDFLITSRSSFSYTAAYFCGGCHVVYTRPKEWTYGGTMMNKDNYRNSVFYVDGWVPDFEYLGIEES